MPEQYLNMMDSYQVTSMFINNRVQTLRQLWKGEIAEKMFFTGKKK